MKQFLMVIFAPFALIGGTLIGYHAHAIRVAPEFSFLSFFNDYPLLLVGVGLVGTGFFVRHWLTRSFTKRILELETRVREANRAKDDAHVELGHARIKMAWIDDVISKAVNDSARATNKPFQPPEPIMPKNTSEKEHEIPSKKNPEKKHIIFEQRTLKKDL